jgi:hypothetical protein
MNILLVKVDPQLNIEWQKEYGGTTGDFPSSVLQTSDGGYLVSGWTYSFDAQSADCYLLKTDSDGTVEFETTYGTSQFDRLIDVCETDDGCYMGLWVKYFPTSTTIVQIDQQGNIEWMNQHMGRNASSLLQNDDDTIVITGVKSDNFLLMCADNLGNQLWETLLNAGTFNHCGMALYSNNIGGYFVAANTNPGAGMTYLWLLNFESYTGITIEDPASAIF